MDKINASDDALMSAMVALRDFGDTAQELTKTCKSVLEDELSDLDVTFASDIARFLKVIKTFDQKVSEFTTENTAALQERCQRIAEYERQTYKKRYFA